MSDKLKIQKVKGDVIIDFGGAPFSMNGCTVYSNGWGEKDLVLLIQDKNDPNKKVQLTFTKPAEFVEPKKEEVKETPKEEVKGESPAA